MSDDVDIDDVQDSNPLIPAEWIPFLKLNWILSKIGCIIQWEAMDIMKEFYEEYINDETKINFTKSGCSFDWHCGSTVNREYIDDHLLLIDKIKFSALAHHNITARGIGWHRCLFEEEFGEKTRFEINPDSDNHFCDKHIAYKSSDHPFYTQNNDVITVKKCGFKFVFNNTIEKFLDDMISCYDHINWTDVANWNEFDIDIYPLRSYLLMIQENRKRKALSPGLPHKYSKSNDELKMQQNPDDDKSNDEQSDIVVIDKEDKSIEQDNNNLIINAPTQSSKQCRICNKISNLQRCPCHTVWYCSKKCQRKDWISSHHKSCPLTIDANNNASKQSSEKSKQETLTTSSTKTRTKSKSTKTRSNINSHSVCLDPFQKELKLKCVDLNLTTRRGKKRVIEVCLKHGQTMSQAMIQIKYLRKHPNAKDWSAIDIIEDIHIPIYSDDEVIEDDTLPFKSPIESAKRYLREKYEKSIHLTSADIYNKQYTYLDLLNNTRNNYT